MGALADIVKANSVFILLFLTVFWLRKKGKLDESNSALLSRIALDICLPATIFISVASLPIHLRQFKPSLIMLGSELICLALAWQLSKLAGLEHKQRRAVIFCAAFGSSTFLGYPFILMMFPQVKAAMREAIFISEIGVGYPIFILGPILACYFGENSSNRNSLAATSLAFIKTPVFISLVAGIFWSVLRLPPGNTFITYPLFQFCRVLSGALTLLIIAAVALTLRFKFQLGFGVALMLVVVIKLLLKPVLVFTGAQAIGFPSLWQDVLIILASMPPAMLGVVFLKRYGGDAELASSLLFSATFISCLTVTLIYALLG